MRKCDLDFKTFNLLLGHSQFDPLIRDATICAIDEMKIIAMESQTETSYHDPMPKPTYQIPEPYYKKKYR